jgi:hypothetical protein
LLCIPSQFINIPTSSLLNRVSIVSFLSDVVYITLLQDRTTAPAVKHSWQIRASCHVQHARFSLWAYAEPTSTPCSSHRFLMIVACTSKQEKEWKVILSMHLYNLPHQQLPLSFLSFFPVQPQKVPTTGYASSSSRIRSESASMVSTPTPTPSHIPDLSMQTQFPYVPLLRVCLET